MASQPAWQTEELKDEWPDQVDDVSELHTRSISLTIPVGSLHRPVDSDTDPSQDTDVANVVGTFLIRHDAPPPLPQRTPAQRKGLIKDFFSPIALERMFDPPSPRTPVFPRPNLSERDDPPHQLQVSAAQGPPITSPIHGQDGPASWTHRWRPDMPCQFTFSVPHPVAYTHVTPRSLAQDKKTAGDITAIVSSTDPPLRLFQFQYDTFTRDHLSAMVDSIAVNSPSASNTGNFVANTSSPFGLPHVSEASTHSNSVELRSAKRVKLSPASDFPGFKTRTNCAIRRPICRNDYVGESRFLMTQIKNARDSFSNPPSVNDLKSNDNPPLVPTSTDLDSLGISKDLIAAGPSDFSKRKGHSSLGYRQQAESLMAQLKQDMKGSKRIFSTDTTDPFPSVADTSRPTPPSVISSRSHQTVQNQRSLLPTIQRMNSPKMNFMDTSMASSNTSRIHAHFPTPPILVASPPSPPPQPPDPILRPNTTTLDVDMGTNGLLFPAVRTAASAASSVVPGRPNEDLNRFVSSSTVSGTAGSSGSFVKHPGPAQITRIGPEDVPALPERVGRMVFDKTMMRWVKASVMELPRTSESGGGGSVEVDAESEDPFRDIESLREDSLAGEGVGEQAPPSTDNSDVDEVGDQEEMELTSFSFDGPSHNRMRTTNVSEDDTTDSDNDDEDVTDVSALSASLSVADPPEVSFDQESSDEEVHHEPTIAKTTSGPPRDVFVPTPIRSALKSTVVSPAVLFVEPVISSHLTPTSKTGHRRSVSFSDGKREGPIRGLGRSTDADTSDSELLTQVPLGESTFEPSARSKRIGEILDGLESRKKGCIDDKSPTSSTPPPAGTSLRSIKHSLGTDGTSDTGVPTSDVPRRVDTRSQPSTSPSVGAGVGAKSNATFLTEASFGIAHDRLVQVITDVQPFEPYWEEVSSIDLANKNIESVARLNEFLPRLHTLSLNANQLAWLSGVPATVRSLSVSRNSLTRATSFSHLLSLEHLDISYNKVESLSQLECLRHLRELRADGNYIRAIEGLQRMDCLVKLSLQRNRIADMDFTQCSWPKLEVLNASQNRIQRTNGLSLLPSLVVLNLGACSSPHESARWIRHIDNNSLVELKTHGILPRLRILRLSANRLKCVDASHFPNLRMLYIDNNALTEVKRANKLARLENLSLRNQGGNGLSLSMREVRDVKRLYLSGNALPADFLSEPCYNLIYLEIAACRLSKLPTNFSALVPNLRVLNLNYNFLDDVKPLEGLQRLNKITIIGSRLKGTKGIIKVLRRCTDVEMVDFRMNPCTLGWYLPLLVRDVPGALQPSEAGPRGDGTSRDGTRGVAPTLAWHELDAKFRRDLPDEAYIGRLTYRGLIMRACPRVRMLDGVAISWKEREKAAKLLEGVALAKA
ncbi:hypothetical protein BC827DRAFT_1333024 [Russula dissimulans]|nr:hypothetical protein BC827DRAFT_1333024 [Russula dissimulans]